MKFQEFPLLIKQHGTLYDSLQEILFQGDPGLILEKVEREIDPEGEIRKSAVKADKEANELAST